MGELALDYPHIHQVTFEGIAKPLLTQQAMAMKFIKWVPPEAPKDDDDDLDLNASDAQFRLAALMLEEYLNDPEKYKFKNLDQLVAETPLKEFLEKRRDKIDDADQLWADVNTDLKDAHKQAIVKLLKGE